MSIRVVLVDDHPIVLQGLQHLFARQPDLEVAACCATVAEGMTAARAARPDVIVLDLRMPDGGGLALLDALASEQPGTRTDLYAWGLGPQGPLGDGRLHAGERWIDPGATSRLLQPAAPPDTAAQERAASLTGREREVVRMIASGLRNRDIGERLSISENTVKVHLHNIYEKLGVDGRMELLLLAQELKLV